jgi:hypothetical protein
MWYIKNSWKMIDILIHAENIWKYPKKIVNASWKSWKFYIICEIQLII